MKRITVALLGVVAIAATGFAGDTSYSSGKTYKEFKQPIIEPTPCFADNELQLDVFATYQAAENGKVPWKDGWGGGVGLNYFWARYWGLGIEAHWNNASVDNEVYHNIGASLILRYPIEGEICLAPYIFGGAGGHFNSSNFASGHIGGGVEVRLQPTIGLFVDGRWVITDDNRTDAGLFRGGLRFVF